MAASPTVFVGYARIMSFGLVERGTAVAITGPTSLLSLLLKLSQWIEGPARSHRRGNS